MQQFRIDVADINGNGRPEIFVTRMLDGRVSSYVVEFENGPFAGSRTSRGSCGSLDIPAGGWC